MDEWTTQPGDTMRRVAAFLGLRPYEFTIHEAHNTHLARSVHVAQQGASNLSEVATDTVEAALSYSTHCILHEFFQPFQKDSFLCLCLLWCSS